MADYGMKAWDASGDLQLDTTENLTILMHSEEVGSTDSGSIDISGYGNANDLIWMAMPLETGGTLSLYASHSLFHDFVNEELDYAPQSSGGISASDSLILIFKYR